MNLERVMTPESKGVAHSECLRPKDALIFENRWAIKFSRNRDRSDRNSAPRDRIKIITLQDEVVKVARRDHVHDVYLASQEGYNITMFRLPNKNGIMPYIEVGDVRIDIRWSKEDGPRISLRFGTAPIGSAIVKNIPSRVIGAGLVAINRS